MTLEEILQKYYDNERNVHIHSFWDGGWYVRLGDHANGYDAQVNVESLEEAKMWLINKFQIPEHERSTPKSKISTEDRMKY